MHEQQFSESSGQPDQGVSSLRDRQVLLDSLPRSAWRVGVPEPRPLADEEWTGAMKAYAAKGLRLPEDAT